MAHTHVTHMPSRLGTIVPTERRRSQVVKRRRLLLLVMGIILVILGIWANCGPLRAYVDAKARLADVNVAVAELSAQKAELETQLSRLGEADYLESLARQDLSYTRPGEELYIVTGGGSGASQEETAAGGTGQSGGQGFLERALSPILD